jgi:NADH-quinone oxidoreductase subunit L
MSVPLVILSVFALLVGFVIAGEVFRPVRSSPDHFALFLGHTPSLAYGAVRQTTLPGPPHFNVAVLSTIVALSGIGCAAFLYLGSRREVEALRSLLDVRWLPIYRLSRGKFFFDELYEAIVVKPCRYLARVSDALDRGLVDGLVNVCARFPLAVGRLLRKLQVGMVPFYGLAMVLGMLTLIAAKMIWGGG